MMTTIGGYALFDTPLGRCGIAWGGGGILGVQLPEADERATRARMGRRWPGVPEAPPSPEARRAIDGIRALLAGERGDLADVPLDMDGVADFDRRVYEAARTIPAGATLTYGQVAARLGEPGAAREVGQALARNPFAIVVPCHRVVAAGGKTGGFSAGGGVGTKLRLLALEGAAVTAPLPLLDAPAGASIGS
jgi:methylated-DNA-[protein]-cysteine S-methyltransferase